MTTTMSTAGQDAAERQLSYGTALACQSINHFHSGGARHRRDLLAAWCRFTADLERLGVRVDEQLGDPFGPPA